MGDRTRFHRWPLVLLLAAVLAALALTLGHFASSRPLPPAVTAERVQVVHDDGPRLGGHPLPNGDDADAPPLGQGAISPSHSENGPILSGVVLEEGTEVPIEGALVLIIGPEDAVVSINRATKTQSDGTFAVSRPQEGWTSLGLLVRSADHVDTQTPLNCVASTDSRVVVYLQAGDEISGTVVDGLGKPIAGARLVCVPPGNHFSWPSSSRLVSAAPDCSGATAISGEDGRFLVRGLRPGQTYAVHAEKSGYTSERRRVTDDALVGAGTRDVRLTLLESCEFLMRVVDGQTGRLIPYASVIFRPLGGVSTFRPAPGIGALQGDGTPALARGAIRVRLRSNRGARPPSSVAIQAHAYAMGYASVREVFEVNWVRPGEVVFKLGRLTEEEPIPVRFRIEFASDKPYSGPLVLFFRRQRDESGAKIPSVAELEFDAGLSTQALPLVPGRYWVSVRANGMSGVWWRPRSTLELMVPEEAEGEHRATLRVEGGGVVLSVIDKLGRKRRGYSLAITYSDGTGSSRVRGWDFPGYSESGVREQTAFVRPLGGTVRAWIPGVGSGEATFPPLCDGTLKELTVRLDQPAPLADEADVAPHDR